MNNPQFCFVDTAFGDVSHRNNVLDVWDVNSHVPQDHKDCYCTYHRFPKVYAEHRRKIGSTKGYKGTSYTDFIPFDFDSDDLTVSQERTRDFLKVLEVSYEVDGLHGVRCWFSGKKGFHVGLSSTLFGGWTPALDLAVKLKVLAKVVGQGLGIDPAIYDQNRLLRMQNTIHGVSGLWKIPLLPMEILTESIETIQAWASASRKVEWPDWSDVTPRPPLVQVWESIKKGQQGKEKKKDAPPELFPVDMAEGDGRDKQAFFIARWLRDNGLNPPAAIKVIEFWDARQNEPLGLEVVQDKVKSAYGTLEGPEGNRVTVESLKTLSELAVEYTAYIESLKTRKINFGFGDLDRNLRGVAPGEVCTVIARAGVGKSAFLQNVFDHISKSQTAVMSVYCSMEQPLAQCFERWAQMSADLSGREIEEDWLDLTVRQSIVGKMVGEFGDRVLTCGISGLRMDELGHVLDRAQEKTGRQVNLLGLDYLSLLDMSDLDKTSYGQVSKAARQLKTFAKQREVSILILCQVHRGTGENEDSPLTIHSARESGAIEESADFLLGLYRKDDGLALQILKNRKGQTGEFMLKFDHNNLRMNEVSFRDEPEHSYTIDDAGLARSQRGAQ